MPALGRYIVDAIVLEHRSPIKLARDHGISRGWIYRLLPTRPANEVLAYVDQWLRPIWNRTEGKSIGCTS